MSDDYIVTHGEAREIEARVTDMERRLRRRRGWIWVLAVLLVLAIGDTARYRTLYNDAVKDPRRICTARGPVDFGDVTYQTYRCGVGVLLGP